MSADGGQGAILGGDLAGHQGLVDVADIQGLAGQGRIVGELGDHLVLFVGVLGAAVLAGRDHRVVDLLGLGETFDRLDDGRTGATLFLLRLDIELGDGRADVRNGDGGAGVLGVGDHLDDQALLLGGELATVRPGGQHELEVGDVGLGGLGHG